MRVDGASAAEELPARRWGGGRGRSAPAARARDRARGRRVLRRLRGRASASSWTSPPASSSIPARVMQRGRSCTASPAARRAVTRSARASCTGSTATRRACSSSRAPRRRTSAFASSSPPVQLERSYVALVRGHPRSWRGTDRRSDRTRPRRADAAVARHGHAARGGHALRGRRAAGRPRAPRTSSSRPAGRTRSASISRPSTCRSWATRSTGCPTRRSAASSCTRAGSRSTIRSRVSGSTSNPRFRTTWPRSWGACGTPARLLWLCNPSRRDGGWRCRSI